MKELSVPEGSLALIPPVRGQPCQEISAFSFHTSDPDSVFLARRAAD